MSSTQRCNYFPPHIPAITSRTEQILCRSITKRTCVGNIANERDFGVPWLSFYVNAKQIRASEALNRVQSGLFVASPPEKQPVNLQK